MNMDANASASVFVLLQISNGYEEAESHVVLGVYSNHYQALHKASVMHALDEGRFVIRRMQIHHGDDHGQSQGEGDLTRVPEDRIILDDAISGFVVEERASRDALVKYSKLKMQEQLLSQWFSVMRGSYQMQAAIASGDSIVITNAIKKLVASHQSAHCVTKLRGYLESNELIDGLVAMCLTNLSQRDS